MRIHLIHLLADRRGVKRWGRSATLLRSVPGWCNWQHTRLWIWLSWFESRPRSQSLQWTKTLAGERNLKESANTILLRRPTFLPDLAGNM
jgi:hypothetical protein